MLNAALLGFDPLASTADLVLTPDGDVVRRRLQTPIGTLRTDYPVQRNRPSRWTWVPVGDDWFAAEERETR